MQCRAGGLQTEEPGGLQSLFLQSAAGSEKYFRMAAQFIHLPDQKPAGEMNPRHRCLKLRQFSGAPVTGNIGEGIIGCIEAIVTAQDVGDAFGFDFLLPAAEQITAALPVMQEGMGNLMGKRFDRLQL